MTITHLITHFGGFHAALTASFTTSVVIFDAAAQIFDHHQRTNPSRVDDQPYSTFLG